MNGVSEGETKLAVDEWSSKSEKQQLYLPRAYLLRQTVHGFFFFFLVCTVYYGLVLCM